MSEINTTVPCPDIECSGCLTIQELFSESSMVTLVCNECGCEAGRGLKQGEVVALKAEGGA